MILEQYLASTHGKTIIFDSIIRTMEQVREQGDIIKDFFIIIFDLPRDVAIQRLSGRRYDPITQETFGPDMPLDHNPKTGVKLIVRHDDTPDAIESRVNLYYSRTVPANEYLGSQGIPIHTVDANRTVDEVFADVQRIIKSYQ